MILQLLDNTYVHCQEVEKSFRDLAHTEKFDWSKFTTTKLQARRKE